MDYISKCTDDVTTTKTITVHSYQKPWMTGEFRSLLRTCDTAFRSGDIAGLKTARNNLSRGIGIREQRSSIPGGYTPTLLKPVTHVACGKGSKPPQATNTLHRSVTVTPPS